MDRASNDPHTVLALKACTASRLAGSDVTSILEPIVAAPCARKNAATLTLVDPALVLPVANMAIEECMSSLDLLEPLMKACMVVASNVYSLLHHTNCWLRYWNGIVGIRLYHWRFKDSRWLQIWSDALTLFKQVGLMPGVAFAGFPCLCTDVAELVLAHAPRGESG